MYKISEDINKSVLLLLIYEKNRLFEHTTLLKQRSDVFCRKAKSITFVTMGKKNLFNIKH
jgi:hypothetical protein